MTMNNPISEGLGEVRRSVRELVEEWLDAGKFTPSCDAWLRHYDLNFTKALADRGLIGISWPVEVGGGGLSGLARLVVTEELLRVGAPVAAHWIADRQIGPSILKHGSAAAKEKYLPGIAAGEVTFCLGMSETESGSDLASVSTKAVRTDGGWAITGRKIWTSQAHRSTHAYVLARTSKGESKHEGLSEFIVDMSDPGVEVRPIYDLRGEHHFNEVTFDSVSARDDHVIGELGDGWGQVAAQLSLERGGIERILSTYPLLSATLETVNTRGALGQGDACQTGEILARLATLRAMAFDVASAIDEGKEPIFEAAMLKDLGTGLEREINELARLLLDTEADPTSEGPEGLLAQGILAAPGFSIRGGTTEVLRTIIARGVSNVGRAPSSVGDDLSSVVDEVLAGQGAEPGESLPDVWNTVRGLGWTAVAIAESAGGEGGDLDDVATIVQGLARHSVSLPLAETILARRALVAAGESIIDAAEVATVALPQAGEDVVLSADGRLRGAANRIPWGMVADELVVFARTENGNEVVVRLPSETKGMLWTKGANLAGEPRDDLVLDAVDTSGATLLAGPSSRSDLFNEAALLRVAATLGALETAFAATVEHVNTRIQFGKPLIKFQAVCNLLACFASELECTKVALSRAVSSAQSGESDAWTRVAAARVVAGRSATEGARIAHQLHAAMGVTREHPLHLSTRRLWSWRDEWGTQRVWAERLGRSLSIGGPDELWRWITEQSAKGSA